MFFTIYIHYFIYNEKIKYLKYYNKWEDLYLELKTTKYLI